MTDPYLRPADPDGGPQPPPGCVASPIGRWEGVEREVVYNPRRHDILVVRGPAGDVDRSLPDAGFSSHARAPEGHLWIRDRLAPQRELRPPVPTRSLGISL